MKMPNTRRLDLEPMVEINMMPLVSVMLVLVTMFIITMPIQSQSINFSFPLCNIHVPITPPKVNYLTIDFDGTIYWDQEVIDHATLETKLAGMVAKKDQTELHLSINNLAKYHHVVKVMAAAQRLGVSSIGLVSDYNFNFT